MSRSDPAAAALRPVLVHHDATVARVSLVPDGALLVAGDGIEVDVTVDAGAWLDLIEPGGTVAYDMRGGHASWDVRIQLGAGARLTWAGRPFVVSAGADVGRSTVAQLADGAYLALRETVVLGRDGEWPGTLRQRITVERDGHPVLVEDLPLGPWPTSGLIGKHRVLASVLCIGAPVGADVESIGRLDLDDGGVMWRRLGVQAHETTLDTAWQVARGAVAPP
ncbi:urease accessory protein [Jiangella anatolica]|uniref:Urease accessory protein n=1 Tax=Jiangella anatolica TaxID=2670374 RepID=A0A2W2BKI8_9ACTN|nr:urease accessory protein [Jiangella anatolica]